jgi:hypothetical protein
MSWNDLIRTTTVGDLLKTKSKKLVVIKKGATLREALHVKLTIALQTHFAFRFCMIKTYWELQWWIIQKT